jgi:hypothetical protein
MRLLKDVLETYWQMLANDRPPEECYLKLDLIQFEITAEYDEALQLIENERQKLKPSSESENELHGY